MIIGDLYENREAKTAGQYYSTNPTVLMLLGNYRVLI